ncbi:MAG: ribonuclease P protein component [Clostridia bacterium]|nr:ribonuclease P protein component [Clostridia bacterium]
MEKIKQNFEFRRAYSRGKAYVTPFFVIYVFKTRKSTVRLGVTTGKKIGKAVARNRARRVITAAFRENLPFLSTGYDFVIVARTRILTVKSTTAAAAMKKQLQAAGLWNRYETDQ